MQLLVTLKAYPELFIIIVGMFAALIGSFLNVVIYRLPVMMKRDWTEQCCELLEQENPDTERKRFDLIMPGSRCPHCETPIKAYQNIPVISYCLLGGKCGTCKESISIRYPIIEALTAIAAMIVAADLGIGMGSLMACLLTFALISLIMIDYDHQLLPDDITLPFLWLGIICNYWSLFTDLESSILGAIFGYLSFWTVYILFKLVTGKEGMGHGDFKLLAMLGAWLGWQYLPLIIVLSPLVGAAVGIFLVVTKLQERSKPIPFGPFLATAGWIALIWGDTLNRLYLNSLG